jgi:SNF2 family DNA or RNA helicase
MDNSKAITIAFNAAKQKIKGRLDGHYQSEGVKWMLGRELSANIKGGILADDMGLGKTIQAITTMRGNPQPTLIITMVSIVGQWKDALINFGGMKPIIVNPSFMGILPLDEMANDTVVLTSYSSFQKSKGETPPCLLEKDWGRIILDEGHIIRNKKTKLYKEITSINAKIKWVLSGTPIQNDTKDLWTLATWIGADTLQNIECFCKDYVLRRTQSKEAEKAPRLALPPLETQVKYMTFKHKEELAMYKSVEAHYEELLMEKSNYNTAMEGIIRCRQICSHPQIYFDGCEKKLQKGDKKNKKRKHRVIIEDDEDSEYESIPAIKYFNGLDKIPSTKIEFLCDDIKSNVVKHKNKCLVFCTWTMEMKLIQQALKQASISALIFDGSLSRDNKDNVLYNFKNTSIPVLILQITCGSTGLNLQCASHVYIMSPNWNPCIELQAIGRSYRKGQTNKVTCVRLVMENTIEERCLEIQTKKMAMIMETMMDESLEAKLGCIPQQHDDISDIFCQKKAQNTQKQEIKVEDNITDDEIDRIFNTPFDEFAKGLGLDSESEDVFWKELENLPCVKNDTISMYDGEFSFDL